MVVRVPAAHSCCLGCTKQRLLLLGSGAKLIAAVGEEGRSPAAGVVGGWLLCGEGEAAAGARREGKEEKGE